VRTLDFVGIGAAKSGTTTLFRLLAPHPRIFLPAGKEVPYFSKDSTYSLGWQAYLDEHFASAGDEQLLGTITPRYLGDLHVPERMHALLPDARLLALLRNPIDRAHSKYRMLVRSGEGRSFRELIEEQLEPAALERARAETLPLRDSMVVRGEYGRLLGTYLAHYPREQLHIALTDDLERDPQLVVDDVLGFLGLPPWRSPAAGVRAYEGGVERFPFARRLARNPALARVWRLLPRERRRAIDHRFRTEVNVKRTSGDAAEGVPDDVRARLAAFYRPDVAVLEEVLGAPVPWTELRQP
jgi:hypothetical protein